MKIRDIMTRNVETISADTPLQEAAATMERLDTGFLPIGSTPQDKLLGVVTDRDITVRGVAKGLDPANTTVDRVKSDRVLYCFEDDSAEDAARNMGEQEVYRLVVLDNAEDKRLSGIVTLADIGRSAGVRLSGAATREISA
ncbi:MAG: CBS domain-containing protein [Xanthomonadales bacterium]|jgi:CBS domain-containing protein|nr:CBS domain-containing protein [Xanthomonadales bacterium]